MIRSLPSAPRALERCGALTLTLLLAGASTWAQEPPAPQPSVDVPAAADSPGDPPADPKDGAPTFFNTVTVTATMNPVAVKDAAGTVSVITASEIARGLIENTADLLRFEPGVYAEANLTRIGLNGFNIRGIGGNRVMTQVDGVETSEQFDFGPFNVHQFTLDLDTLKSAELVRSAGSSMYGSDALGGVVSFFTKDPADYLAGQRLHLGGKALYDSRSRDTSGNVVVAGGRSGVQASLFGSYSAGHEPRNRGGVDTTDARRTRLNPQDRSSGQVLGKAVVSTPDWGQLRGAVELADTRVKTAAYSLRTAAVPDIDSDDDMARQRYAVDHAMTGRLGLNTLSWNLYVQRSDTAQVVNESRVAAGRTPAVQRAGTLDFSQDSFGLAAQGRKALTPGGSPLLITAGGSHKHHAFDMFRDRLDVDASTGAVVPNTGIILPTKYFPRSDVGETGAYVQAELQFQRLTLLPGIRYDRFTMDADQDDPVFIATLSPPAADFEDDRLSSRVAASYRVSDAVTLHAQYAGGFRAPPYSAVNSGFTNVLGGYTSVPNPNLRAETSDNIEGGVRVAARHASVGATVFSNHYDDFILQESTGLDPVTGLLTFQYQNLSRVRIQGIELRGDVRLASTLRLRGAYARIRGNDVSSGTDVPLQTIAPDQGTLGLQYTDARSRWGSDLTLRLAGAQSPERAGDGSFAPDAYQVVDLSGWLSLRRDLTLRAAVLNLTDARYFEWTNVRGRSAADPVIDRYSSPGISAMVGVSYGW